MALMVFDEKWFISTASYLALRDCADHSVAGDMNVVENRALTASFSNAIPSKANLPTMKKLIFSQMEANTVSAFGLLLGSMLGMAIAVCPNFLINLYSMSLPNNSACLCRRSVFDMDGSPLTTTTLNLCG